MPPAAMKIDGVAAHEAVLSSENEASSIHEEDANADLVSVDSGPRKRGTPLCNADDDETPVKRRKKHRKSHDSVEEDEDEGHNHKENNGRRPDRTSNSNRSNRDVGATSPDINSALGGGQHRNVNSVGKPPEAGIILKIYVENFMCHRKLTVDLCRNVNFIYGQNGSGKSAILAAIQICLGAGARRTNRARNLKELVRKDAVCACAKIRVTLLNKGDDAYEPDIYGDSITVERTIALRGGYNGYKLYDSNMNEKSRSKRDLDDMLDKLNIQVENPVAILDQEEAKKFLTGKAADKYQFFIKATELERIDVSYRNAVEQVGEMQNQADRLRDNCMADKELMDEAKREVKKHQEIGKLEVRKKKLEAQLAWSVYNTKMTLLEERQEKLEVFKEKAEKKRQELTQAEAVSQEGEDGDEERRNHLESISKEAEESSERKTNLERVLKRAVEPHKALQRQLNLLKKAEKKANIDLLNANKVLQVKRDEIAARAGSAETEQARRNEILRREEEKLAEEKARHSELKQAVHDAFVEYENLEPQVSDARKSVAYVENQMGAIKSRIQSMKSSSGNSLDVFGPRCATVKTKVDRAIQQGQFSGPVLGPIGYYCKVQPGKEEFAAIAEIALGQGILDRFVVCNDADRKLFQQIRRQSGCQGDCGVFQQSQYPRYQIPGPPQMEGVETVASVFSVQNDVIFNCLVDNAKIDERALTRSKEESERQLLVRDSNGRNSIRANKIKEVFFLPRGDCWKITKGGSIQMISNTRNRMKQTIGVDTDGAIREAEIEYQSLKDDLMSLNSEYGRLEHEHTECKRRWNFNKRQLQENEKAIDESKNKIERVKSEENNAADMDIDTSAEEQDVTEAQEVLDEIRENEVKLKQEIEEKSPEIQDLQDKLVEVTERNKKVLADLQQAETALSQFYDQVSQQQAKLQKKRQKLEQYNTIIEQHSEGIYEAEKDAKASLKIAKVLQYNYMILDQRRKEREAQGEEVDLENSQNPPHSANPSDEEIESIGIPDDLQKLEKPEHYRVRVERAEEKIEEEKERRLNSRNDDLATAMEKYIRAKEVYVGKRNKIKEIHSAVTSMREDMKLRQARWLQFREFISEYSGMKFDETLNIKGSSGTIEFDHTNGALDLIVQKDSSNENSQQRDVKALSGGERSFTTIALLLALGEMLETPFRVMDEFDVFLDPVTRKLIIDTLIEVGQGMGHRQFIFITPQDVSNVESSPTLKILKMKPPERREVAGGHTQQTLDFLQQG